MVAALQPRTSGAHACFSKFGPLTLLLVDPPMAFTAISENLVLKFFFLTIDLRASESDRRWPTCHQQNVPPPRSATRPLSKILFSSDTSAGRLTSREPKS